jgi:hypothetical protein
MKAGASRLAGRLTVRTPPGRRRRRSGKACLHDGISWFGWRLQPRRCHLGKYGKDCLPNVIYLTLARDQIGLFLVDELRHQQPRQPQPSDRYNLNDLFNLETKDF